MLDRLDAEEQRALMELLIYVAKADGVVRDIEDEVLHEYAELLELDFGDLDGSLTPDELIPRFNGPASYVAVLQELLCLSHLDGRFSSDEKSAILDVARRMGVGRDMLRKIDEWVVEGLQWMLRGEELMEEAEETAAASE
jgi:tellurite resistance protein